MERNQYERTELGAIIGNNIHDIRTRLGISQEALGHSAGIQQSYIGKLERGQIVPGAAILDRIAHALGVCVGLLFEKDPARRFDPQKCPYKKEHDLTQEHIAAMFQTYLNSIGDGGKGVEV